MSRKLHRLNLEHQLAQYARQRALEFKAFSMYHMRITDPGYTEVDCWTTGRYYIRQTVRVERNSEKGSLPDGDYLPEWLDNIFYYADTEAA